MLLLENEAQIDKNNYGTTLFVLKQVSLPKISLILQKHLSHAWHPSSEEILKNQSLFILSKNKRRNPLFSCLDADPCRLACRSRSSFTYHGIVADGTRCTNRPNIFDVCVAGKCKVCIILLDEVKHIYISRLRIDR